MKTQKLLIALTAVNLGMLFYQQLQPGAIHAAGVAPVLRGRALEIVDDQGRVRATLGVLPPDTKHRKSDGKPYPETVLLRLITSEGRPNVKLGASKDGSGLGLGGESDPTYVQVLAQGAQTTLKLTNKDGQARVINP
jgi:hypothetical protein